ncbi:MAG: hypothetical protein LAP21_27205 [Acidobacteriia bacterium]|nr:hypothetical protein [Terriglobia bacterium]
MFRDLTWSKTEKDVAKTIYANAYDKECRAILARLKQMTSEISDPEGIWGIYDYLSEQRKQFDGKYDYRYSVLPMVFARLIREGWLTEADLKGLREDKLEIIGRILRLGE